MNLRQVEIFRAVMATGSVTQASIELNLSQPAVSKALTALERSLGFALFVRQKGRLAPTHEGLSLYEGMANTFAVISQMDELADNIRLLHMGRLVVASCPFLSHSFMPRAVAAFAKGRDKVSMVVHSRTSPKILDWAVAQQIDLGLTTTPSQHVNVRTKLFARVRCVCVLPKNHPLESKVKLQLNDFSGEAFVSLRRGELVRTKIDRTFEDASIQRELRIEAQVTATACGIVAEGYGISIVDEISARQCPQTDVVIRPLAWDEFMEVWMVLPTRRPEGRLTAAFENALLEQRAMFPGLHAV